MKITSIKDGGVLFEGPYSTMKKCLEQAVKTGADLSFANLRKADLRGAALDGMSVPGACFWGADLSGADMADAYLHKGDFRLAKLEGTCLAGTVCSSGDFRGAYFSNLILDGADLSAIRFSCPNFLRQDFSSVKSIRAAVYHHLGEMESVLSVPPVFIRGLEAEIVILGDHIKLGESVIDIRTCPPALKKLVSCVSKNREQLWDVVRPLKRPAKESC